MIKTFNINQNTPNQGNDSVMPNGERYAPKNIVTAIAEMMNILINSAKISSSHRLNSYSTMQNVFTNDSLSPERLLTIKSLMAWRRY